MWIYSKTGRLLNCDWVFTLWAEDGMTYAKHGKSGVSFVLSEDSDDMNRIYHAMNAGVAVLDLRGEQHG